MIDAIIVDDDNSARAVLKKYIELDKRVRVVDSVNNTVSAANALLKKNVDLIFLDINMPKEDGISFAERLRANNLSIPIVFTTAYRDYALQAINIRPIDYLVKPFGYQDVEDVITKVADHLVDLQGLRCYDKWGLSIPNKIKLRSNEGFVFEDPVSILYFRAMVGYIEMVDIQGCKHKICWNMAEVTMALAGFNFIQLSRSVIVNIDYITRVDKRELTVFIEKNERQFSFRASKGKIKKLEQIDSIKLG